MRGRRYLKLETKSIMSNCLKIRLAFAETLSQIVTSDRTTTSSSSATFLAKAGTNAGINGWVMFFLLRMGFWLGVVCLLLPAGGAKSPDAKIDATQAMTVASAAVSDARGFCERQPDACVSGGKVAVALGQRAEAGVRTLYQFISERLADKPAEAEKTAQADRPAAKLVAVSDRRRGTLTRNDMQPAWHAPVPLPPRRARPPV